MAIAKFHSVRGAKSALIMVKPNAFVFSASPVYVPRVALPHHIDEAGEIIIDLNEGDEITIPDGYILIDMVDPETGEVRTASDGTPLKVLSY